MEHLTVYTELDICAHLAVVAGVALLALALVARPRPLLRPRLQHAHALVAAHLPPIRGEDWVT